ncbi:MAG: glycosyltransferase family 4 protein [Bacteroidia bacterium]|nr:glycosyltransferase family 4 protein [Bacteroidia bacterium]
MLTPKLSGLLFYYVDEFARWHDLHLPAPLRYARWLQNALRFPYRSYDGLLIEGPHVWPSLAGKLAGVPVWSIVDDHTLYFLYSGFFSPTTQVGLRFALRHYTGLFIVGKMLARLARELLGRSCPPLHVLFNGVAENRLKRLLEVKPKLESSRIVVIAHGPEGWRTHYKGLDLFMATLSEVRKSLPQIEGIVMGEWTEREKKRLQQLYPEAPIRFVGAVQNIEQVLAEAALYFHPARGEAWGIAIQEAMAAGVPAIVSEWTGAAEVVEQVWKQGIVPLDPQQAAQQIIKYLTLPIQEKQTLSEIGRELINTHYTHRQSLEHFQTLFLQAFCEAK